MTHPLPEHSSNAHLLRIMHMSLFIEIGSTTYTLYSTVLPQIIPYTLQVGIQVRLTYWRPTDARIVPIESNAFIIWIHKFGVPHAVTPKAWNLMHFMHSTSFILPWGAIKNLKPKIIVFMLLLCIARLVTKWCRPVLYSFCNLITFHTL